MQTYILMTKLSPELTRRMKDRADLGRAWLDEVKAKCPEVKFISHYALLGPFDFLDIYEAPDEDTAAKGLHDQSFERSLPGRKLGGRSLQEIRRTGRVDIARAEGTRPGFLVAGAETGRHARREELAVAPASAGRQRPASVPYCGFVDCSLGSSPRPGLNTAS